MEAGGEHGVLRAAVETRVEQPVLLALESLDLLLAVNDHARGDGLHTSRGQTLLYLAPEQRGELIADDAVEYAPRLLGIDKVLVDAARVLDALGDDLFGDLVEGHALGLFIVKPKQLLEVP